MHNEIMMAYLYTPINSVQFKCPLFIGSAFHFYAVVIVKLHLSFFCIVFLYFLIFKNLLNRTKTSWVWKNVFEHLSGYFCHKIQIDLFVLIICKINLK